MNNSTVRLFFALWPDDSTRVQIMSRAKHIKRIKKGRLISINNLHMTLHFIGNTNLDNMKCLDQKASQVIARPFTMELNFQDTFIKPGIIWLGCKTPPPELQELQKLLGNFLSGCDYEPEKRDYQPHVTLYRKAVPEEQTRSIAPVTWKTDSFSLIQSSNDRQGVIYKEIRRYPLSVKS